MLPLLSEMLPEEMFSGYVEPFLGGGAAFFAFEPERAMIGDSNRDLMGFYQVVREAPDALVEAVWRFSNERDCYDRVRAASPRTEIGRAARFLYLNRTAWGGMYRVNANGRFNVPFGNNGRVICRADPIHRASRVLEAAEMSCGDFETLIDRATRGDAVFCDPPYVARSLKNGFNRYGEQLFSWEDQQRLALATHRAAARGAKVVVTGPACDAILRLYPRWYAVVAARASNIAAAPSARRSVSELVLFSWDTRHCSVGNQPPRLVGDHSVDDITRL